MALNIFKVVATLVLVVTAYRVATRPFRVAKIDYELHIGYATDRWGEPAPTDPTFDAGKLWRDEQVSRDDRVTFLLCVASIPALTLIGRRLLRLRRSVANVMLAATIPLPLLINGCGTSNPSLSVPEAKSVTIVCFCKKQDLPPLTFAVTNAKQRTDITTSLSSLRLTEPPIPLAEIKMIRPDIDVLLTDKFDKLHKYQLYWSNDSFVDQDSGQFLTVTDISKLRVEVTSITGLTSAPQP